MSTQSGDTPSAPPPIGLGGRDFSFVDRLSPQRDASGAMLEISPQGRYSKRDSAQLHKHGHGPFCRFSISVLKGLVGVYALVVNGSVRYIGECEDLSKQFNMGYGNISPRNCYYGGQSTNCKINRRVLNESKAGRSVELYFYPTSDRKLVETQLVATYAPPWND